MLHTIKHFYGFDNSEIYNLNNSSKIVRNVDYLLHNLNPRTQQFPRLNKIELQQMLLNENNAIYTYLYYVLN